MSNIKSSGLLYYGTNDEVCLGDHVEVRLWFGLRTVRGHVSYLPGLSEKHEVIRADQWAFTADDGTIYVTEYDSVDRRLDKTVRLLGRSEENAM